MIPIFYRTYKYSPLATFFSAFTFLLVLAFGFAGIALFSSSVVGAVICLVIAAACAYELFAHKLADNIAEKNGKKNIETKARYGYMYVRENPQSYDYLVSVNQKFAEKYTKLDDGTVAKR